MGKKTSSNSVARQRETKAEQKAPADKSVATKKPVQQKAQTAGRQNQKDLASSSKKRSGGSSLASARIINEPYRDVYRTDSTHLVALANKFFARAVAFRKLSICVLGFAGLLILAGIVCFLFPSTFTEIGVFQRQMEADTRSIRENIDSLAATYEAATFAEDSFNLYGVLYEIKHDIDINQNDPNFRVDVTRVGKRKFANAREVTRQIASSDPNRTELNVTGHEHHITSSGQIVIPAGVFREAKKNLIAAGLSVTGIVSRFEELQTQLENGTAAQIVTAQKNVAGTLEGIDRLRNEARDVFEDAAGNVTESERERRKFEKDIQDARESINRTLLDAIAKGAASPESAWVPQLTVRIGVVVLLLFFSAILFSTYRYTLTLSAYYAARGDALQMLSKPDNNTFLDPKELAALLPLLSPDTYKVEDVTVPYDSIAKLKG